VEPVLPHVAEGAIQVPGAVPDHCDLGDLHAELGQALRDPGAVSVRHVAAQHLGSCDEDARSDLSTTAHGPILPIRGQRPHARQLNATWARERKIASAGFVAPGLGSRSVSTAIVNPRRLKVQCSEVKPAHSPACPSQRRPRKCFSKRPRPTPSSLKSVICRRMAGFSRGPITVAWAISASSPAVVASPPSVHTSPQWPVLMTPDCQGSKREPSGRWTVGCANLPIWESS